VPASEAARRTEELLDVLNLSQRAHLFPAQLSGGEQQRVAIGRALIKRPALFFADEPTSALDWDHGKQVMEILARAAHQESATVLVVAHDERVTFYADRVLHLEDGAVKRDVDADRTDPRRGRKEMVHP
jgi:putative ABC transport system ATP-binding protein